MYKLNPVTLAPKDKNNSETHIYYLMHTMEQAAILREIVEQAKSLNPLDSASYSACKYVKLIQELLGYVRETCHDIHKPSEKLVAVMAINKKKIVRSKSTDNTKNDKILQISSSTQKKNKVEDHSRIVKSSLNKWNYVVEPSGNANVQHSKLNTNSELMCIKCNSSMFDARHEFCLLEFVSDINASSKSKSLKKAKKKEEWKPTRKVITATNKVPFREPIPLEVIAQESIVTKVYTRRPKVVQIVLWHLESECSKHMIKDRSQLTNFVHKFLSTVKSSNDHILKIMGVKFLASKNATVKNIRTDNGTEFVNQTLRDYYKHVGIYHETSVARTPQQNGVVERRNHMLVEVARTRLIFPQAPLFLWTEAIATACYTQNRSIIRRRHGKTPYELLHDRKPDLSYLHVFGALCYPNNDSDNLGKFQAKADIGIFIGYAPKKKAYRIYNRRLVSNPIPQQPFIPPPRDDWDRLFQPMFDEYFNPSTIVVSPVPVANAPRAVDLADSPVSTSIDQDAPLTSIPSTQDQEHSPIISQSFEESPKTPHFHDDLLYKFLHEDSTS
ncbi:retrovirus-related pol polyprotein from transposon TNT 1-94 [Tanacetum coccineum]